MPYVETCSYANGRVLRAEYQTGGMWRITGDEALHPSTLPGRTREEAHEVADQIAQSTALGAWVVDWAVIQVGDKGPCHEAGCAGELEFRVGPDPTRQGLGVVNTVQTLHGSCSANPDHTLNGPQQ